MRRWIEFYYSEGQPVLGSDGLVLVDGRFGDQRTRALAHAQALRLRKVKPSIAFYKILFGRTCVLAHPITALCKLEF